MGCFHREWFLLNFFLSGIWNLRRDRLSLDFGMAFLRIISLAKNLSSCHQLCLWVSFLTLRTRKSLLDRISLHLIFLLLIRLLICDLMLDRNHLGYDVLAATWFIPDLIRCEVHGCLVVLQTLFGFWWIK